MPTVDEFELDKLRNEVAQERQIVEMLEQSIADLSTTADDLEKRLEGMDEDSCEWKTRYEMQIETNQQLEMQILVLREKVDEVKRTVKDGKFPKNLQMFDDSAEVTPQYVKLLEKSKNVFENQLRDLEWRLEQESKAYHKANEERKNCVMEISDAQGHAENLRTKSRQGGASPRNFGNIAEDQRVIDVRRGPIRRTAAVKTLPKID